jgi:hypothetical protein
MGKAVMTEQVVRRWVLRSQHRGHKDDPIQEEMYRYRRPQIVPCNR